ncbi:MAG: Gfo/Idh/MocA family oxidoreductase [Anaerolineae bacterium]|nr:Gfo/Idh/MocA family oxidoreductase [Anaerolineae bacterium]
MERIPIAIVGCGGMGGRHLRGVKSFYDTDLCNIELVAACDLRRDNAEYLADNAEQMLGKRPQVFESMEAMVRAIPDLEAVDVTTDSGSHHRVVSEALDLGLHVLCEKPLASTIRGCNLVIEKHKGTDLVLSVAEQFRRDPICRLTRALLDAKVIGEPQLLLNVGAGGGDRILIFPWRHVKDIGGIFVDSGVHTTDLMQYYLGKIREVYAQAKVMAPIRYRSPGNTGVSGFYEHWYNEMPESMEATAEDTVISTMDFESGVMGHWTSFQAAHGERLGHEVIYGSKGSLRTAGARNGRPVTLTLDEGGEVPTDKLLDLVPDFHLDEITATLFGADRLASYPFPFPEADRKLIAVEYYELGQCILKGRKPEVDGYVSRGTLAVCHAALESAMLHRPVTISEIEEERTWEYEASIRARWGL